MTLNSSIFVFSSSLILVLVAVWLLSKTVAYTCPSCKIIKLKLKEISELEDRVTKRESVEKEIFPIQKEEKKSAFLENFEDQWEF